MGRTLFTLATLLSLMLCLATASMWVRSYSVDERWWVSTSDIASRMTPERLVVHTFSRTDRSATLSRGRIQLSGLRARGEAVGAPGPDRPLNARQRRAAEHFDELRLETVIDRLKARAPERGRVTLRYHYSSAQLPAPGSAEPLLKRIGFDAHLGLDRGSYPLWSMRPADLSVPCWFVVLLTGTLPMLWGVWFVRHGSPRQRRIARGLCGACGYDLRASRERCPECGSPVPSKHESVA